MKWLLIISIVFVVGACAGKQTADSNEAKIDLESKYGNQIGVATKASFVQEFGRADWCKKIAGEEQCRFYKALGEKWIGPKEHRKSYMAYDEVTATFGADGKLRAFKANSQR